MNKLSVALILSLSATLSASAATISWSAEQINSGTDVSQISTTGTLVEAAYFGNTATATVTLNGVGFQADSGAVLNLVNWDDSYGNVVNVFYPTNANTALSPLLVGSRFTSNSGLDTITLQGLTIGQDYELQLFIADTRTYAGSGAKLLEASMDGGAILANSNVGLNGSTAGTIVSGSFTADALTQDFELSIFDTAPVTDTFAVSQVNAFQLRAIPEPSTGALAFGVIALGLVFFRRRINMQA